MIGAIAVACVIIADALMFYVFGEWIASGWDDERQFGAIQAPLLIAVSLVAFLLPRTLEWFAISGARAYAIAAATAFVMIYGTLRIEFAHDIAIWNFGWVADFVTDSSGTTDRGGPAVAGAMLIIAAWARAAWRATSDLELELVPRYLAIDFGVVTAVVVFGAWGDRLEFVGRGALAFFVVAISALATSQSALSGATLGTLRSGGVTTSLLAGTAAVTGLAVVVFGVVFGFLGDQFGDLVADAVLIVVTIIFTPLAWILQLILGFFIGDAASNISLGELGEVTRDSTEPGESDQSGPGQVAVFAARIFTLLFAIGVGIAIIAVVTRLRRHSAAVRAGAPTRESAGSLTSDLRNLFRRQPAPPLRSDIPPGSIEALYVEVLRDAEHAGQPRELAETPHEFAPRLTSLFHRPITDEITAAFEEARYGGRRLNSEDVTRLKQDWEQRPIV